MSRPSRGRESSCAWVIVSPQSPELSLIAAALLATVTSSLMSPISNRKSTLTVRPAETAVDSTIAVRNPLAAASTRYAPGAKPSTR